MKTTQMTRLFSTAALAAAVTAPALAQEGESGVFGVEGLSAAVSLDVVSQYFFRGYEQQDEGLIFQPGASLSMGLSDSEDVSIGAYVGIWESIHSAPGAGASDSPKSWYESDVYAGVTLATGPVEIGLGYTGYFYPSDVAAEIHEAQLWVGFDDSEYLGEWAVSPYILYAQEFDNDNGQELAYLEIGGGLSFDLAETLDAPVVLDVPFAFGFSIDDYYTDATGDEEVWGYFSIGAVATIPMSELIGTEDHIGGWDFYTGVTLLILNDDVALTDSSSSDEFQVIGTAGISKEW